ncbi:MAG TPA: thiamine-phosphate kinase [Gammaproteobacteria bacterium]|nr:thiamine-phosphate kinase [Gammaproteobacteria bacterium]
MPLSEFELISRYFERPVRRGDVALGIGDDAALLRPPPGQELAVSTDTLIAGVHFREDAAPAGIGYRALAVNLSDLAAMGAEPAWVILALTLPAADEEWLTGFSAGFFELAEAHGVALVGGNTARGPLNITLTVIGFVPEGGALRRDGARPGDAIYVSGTLGDAGFALENWRGADDAARRRLLRPMPRVALGLALRGIASGAVDISDGFAADLGHILERSRVGAHVEVDRLPLSPALKALDRAAAQRYALSSGDDYELCFTVPPAREASLAEIGVRCGCTLTRVGEITAGKGLHLTASEGGAVTLERTGYRHF